MRLCQHVGIVSVSLRGEHIIETVESAAGATPESGDEHVSGEGCGACLLQDG